MEWSSIERIGKIVEDDLSNGLLKIRIELSCNPPKEWMQAFKEAIGSCKSSTIHPPSIDGKNIYITPPSDKIDMYIRHIDERISGANQYYKNTVFPKMQQKEAAREADDKRKSNRIDKAQSELDNIE